jgi:hypothetical protein
MVFYSPYDPHLHPESALRKRFGGRTVCGREEAFWRRRDVLGNRFTVYSHSLLVYPRSEGHETQVMES